MFEACDLDRSGELEYPELRAMIAQLMPGVSASEMRHLLAGLRDVDVDGDGSVTYGELLRGLRLAKIIRVPEGYAALRAKEQDERHRAAAAAATATAGGGKNAKGHPDEETQKTKRHAEDWVLQRLRVHEKMYLLDLETYDVYCDCRVGEWPTPYGKLDEATKTIVPESVDKKGGSKKDLFHELDRFLKDERRRLREVFDEFDSDRDGALNNDDLARLVRRVIPEATEGETEYFLTMLDIDGDG